MSESSESEPKTSRSRSSRCCKVRMTESRWTTRAVVLTSAIINVDSLCRYWRVMSLLGGEYGLRSKQRERRVVWCNTWQPCDSVTRDESISKCGRTKFDSCLWQIVSCLWPIIDHYSSWGDWRRWRYQSTFRQCRNWLNWGRYATRFDS